MMALWQMRRLAPLALWSGVGATSLAALPPEGKVAFAAAVTLATVWTLRRAVALVRRGWRLGGMAVQLACALGLVYLMSGAVT